MTKYDIDFIKKANKFIIIYNDNKKEFTQWSEAVKFYNDNAKASKNIELSAVCGIVAKTLFYKYN